jgi:hypothetical protein
MIASDFGVISGGGSNTISNGSFAAVIGGGYDNAVSGAESTVAGGGGNTASYVYGAAAVGGGVVNTANGYGSVVAGGYDNTASGGYYGACTVSGGSYNSAGPNENNSATVAGGYYDTASGYSSTVAGGQDNTASGDYSFAAGNHAQALHDGSFVWADDHYFPLASTGSNAVFFRCTGGAKFVTAIDGSGNQTAGVHILNGDTAWSSLSDKNAKKNFQPVDGKAVLDKLAAIPVQQWNYKWEADTNTPHLGPMAQDFKHAFYPGRDDKSISTLEFDGVELAAIQGLNQKLNEKDSEIQELKQSVTALKMMVQSLTQNK